MNSGIACLAYLNPGIACLASCSSDWLGALWASLSGVQSSVTFLRLNVIGCCWGGTFNCPASTCWLIDCALSQYVAVLGGSIIFTCADQPVGLFVLCSNWSFRVYVLGDIAEIA